MSIVGTAQMNKTQSKLLKFKNYVIPSLYLDALAALNKSCKYNAQKNGHSSNYILPHQLDMDHLITQKLDGCSTSTQFHN